MGALTPNRLSAATPFDADETISSPSSEGPGISQSLDRYGLRLVVEPSPDLGGLAADYPRLYVRASQQLTRFAADPYGPVRLLQSNLFAYLVVVTDPRGRRCRRCGGIASLRVKIRGAGRCQFLNLPLGKDTVRGFLLHVGEDWCFSRVAFYPSLSVGVDYIITPGWSAGRSSLLLRGLYLSGSL